MHNTWTYMKLLYTELDHQSIKISIVNSSVVSGRDPTYYPLPGASNWRCWGSNLKLSACWTDIFFTEPQPRPNQPAINSRKREHFHKSSKTTAERTGNCFKCCKVNKTHGGSTRKLSTPRLRAHRLSRKLNGGVAHHLTKRHSRKYFNEFMECNSCSLYISIPIVLEHTGKLHSSFLKPRPIVRA